jgi:hypothetical protein
MTNPIVAVDFDNRCFRSLHFLVKNNSRPFNFLYISAMPLSKDYNNMAMITTLTRLCIKCGEEHPLHDFPTGIFRFECKKHVWCRAKQSRKKVFAADPSKRVFWHVWHRAWSDARAVYKKNGIPLKQADIAALFLIAGLVPGMDHRVVPKDACKPLNLDNAALVTTAERRRLIAMWRKDAGDLVIL